MEHIIWNIWKMFIREVQCAISLQLRQYEHEETKSVLRAAVNIMKPPQT